MWDIIGKAVDKPVYKLLGGRVHERLRAYTYLYPRPGDATDVYNDPDLAAERAPNTSRRASRPSSSTRPAPTPRSTPASRRSPISIAASATSRRCARPSARAATSCSARTASSRAAGAIRLARRLEPFDPLWFEEPTPPEMPEEMARVARATSIPIATGERLTTKHEFARVLETGAAAILQPNLGRFGGMLETKKIAGHGRGHYAQIAPHLYCGPIVGAANIQLATCTPNFLILEGIGHWDGFHADLLQKKIHWEDGYVIPPKEPGLGVELNEAVATRIPTASRTCTRGRSRARRPAARRA